MDKLRQSENNNIGTSLWSKHFSKARIKDFIVTTIIGTILAIVIMQFGRLSIVSGESMMPTISNNDIVAVEKVSYRHRQPKKGEIIILDSHRDDVKYFIKRVVATEGDHLQIKEGKVFVNNVELIENYIGDNVTYGNVDIKISKGKVYVLGDNREVSMDSRIIGEISLEDVKYRVMCRVIPLGSLTKAREN